MTIEEILNGCGGAVMESRFAPDDEDPEMSVLTQVAYCRGHLINEEGDYTSRESLSRWYNLGYGLRLWDGTPTDEEREAEPWRT
jgi:hypothetical protein